VRAEDKTAARSAVGHTRRVGRGQGEHGQTPARLSRGPRVEIVADEIAGMLAHDFERGGAGVPLKALRHGVMVGELHACVRADHLRLMGVDVERRRVGAAHRHQLLLAE
jgi:hypothetical protein